MPSPMTHSNRHRIQRQIIELDLAAGARGPELQEALARSFWERTVPELEAVFDRMAGPETLLRLDRLEIDLGTIQGPEWELEFRRKLIEQMTRSLAQAKPVSESGSEPMGRGDSRLPESVRQFLFFLAHGRLPWWGSKPEAGWPDTLLPLLDNAGWAALHQLLRDNSHAIRRLILCVSYSFLATTAGAFADLQEIPRVLAWLKPVGLASADSQRWRQGFWFILLDWVLADGFRDGRGVELMRNLLRLRDRYGRPADENEGPAERWPGHRKADIPMEIAGLSPLPQPWDEWLAVAQARRNTTESEYERQHSRHNGPVPGKESSLSANAEPLVECSVEGGHPAPFLREDEAIYLEGAGAIILHPFLEELFHDRGLLVQRSFRDNAARHRAVHLIGLLSFGREVVPEYDLLLAKLLCGLPFEEPLESADLINDDRIACDTLLHAVLRHWTALHSGSPDWLREQFFLRNGKLEAVDSGWRLTVERRTQDVLLAHLPWGLGVIEWPWMLGRVFVHWLE
jgi:hypothetical protein